MVRSRKLDVDDLAHVGPGTIAGRYLRLFWQPLYRAADLQPGQVKPVTMLGEPFTLYRGHGGAHHLAAFRCAHRGAQLSIGWVEDDCLRCRYHGWKYDATGQCVEQPGEVTTEGVQVVLDAITDTNPAAKGRTPAEFIDNRFVQSLDDQGFIRQLYPD